MNLLTVSTLKSSRLDDPPLLDIDAVMTIAVSFPTTINAIAENRSIPVFVSCRLETYVAAEEQIPNEITPKSRAVIKTQTLGNLLNLEAVIRIAREYDLFHIEDAHDVAGTFYDN